MKRAKHLKWMVAAPLIAALASCSGQSTSGTSGTNVSADAQSSRTTGAPALAAASPAATPSGAQIAARKKAAAQAARRAKVEQQRLAMEIPTWARGKMLRDVPVKKGDKPFALTFDDGPWPGSTRAILSILKKKGAKATFYMVGTEVRARPEIVREILAQGHALGNHSWDHPSRPRRPVDQVKRTNEAIKKATGLGPTSFRPPYGIMASMADEAMRQGQSVLLWSADSLDWRKPGSGRIASTILRQASPGGVALMHDGGGDRDQTIAALPTIIEGLQARGYDLVTVPQLLRRRYVAPPKPKQKPKKTGTNAN